MVFAVACSDGASHGSADLGRPAGDLVGSTGGDLSTLGGGDLWGAATDLPASATGCDPAVADLVVSPDGDDNAAGTAAAPLASINKALSRASAGDTIVVRAGTYHELVEVTLSGTASAPLRIVAACGERPIVDGTGLGADQGEPALFSFLDRGFVELRGFELRNLTGASGNFPAGIWVRGASHDLVIADNLIHDITAEGKGASGGAHGLAVYGTSTTPTERISLVGNELHHLVLGASEALVLNGNVRDFSVVGNYVHDTDNIAFDFIGFEADVCSACTQDDVMSDDVNRVRSGLVVGNRAEHVSSVGNPAYGTDASAGCFYVDGGAAITLERNLATDCDLGVELASEHFGKATRSIVVRNNFLYLHRVTGIATGGYSSGTGAGGGAAADCSIVGNTIYKSSESGWANAGILLQSRNQGNAYVDNLIVASDGSDAIADSGSSNSGNAIDYNLYFGGGLSGVSDGGHSVTQDPLLVAPAAGDLHLSALSPAKNAGVVNAQLGDLDYDGEARLNGLPDIGADELP